MDILRFITAGSVDDGKSTLIGRLLYDSQNILTDQLEALEQSSRNARKDGIDLALLTDGLRSEREQGITIDVAYKYFSTLKRKFIIADAPGHIQYTRNMITGASNVNLAIILVDARHGIVEQTRRHSIIASLLQIPHVVLAVNKLDLVGYSQDIFTNILLDYEKIARQLGLKNVSYIPVSALNGDNIVKTSLNTAWYDGKPLLQLLEDIEVGNPASQAGSRFQVQYVVRPQTSVWHDYRGYAGKILNGLYRKGDVVRILPSGLTTRIRKIEIAGVEVPEARAPQPVIFLLEDEIDISRGDSIIKEEEQLSAVKEIDVLIAWLDEKPLKKGGRYLLRHNSNTVRSIVSDIQHKIDVNTLEEKEGVTEVRLNEIAKATIKSSAPIVPDRYKDLPATGSAILVDETSNNTVAAVLFQ